MWSDYCNFLEFIIALHIGSFSTSHNFYFFSFVGILQSFSFSILCQILAGLWFVIHIQLWHAHRSVDLGAVLEIPSLVFTDVSSDVIILFNVPVHLFVFASLLSFLHTPPPPPWCLSTMRDTYGYLLLQVQFSCVIELYIQMFEFSDIDFIFNFHARTFPDLLVAQIHLPLRLFSLWYSSLVANNVTKSFCYRFISVSGFSSIVSNSVVDKGSLCVSSLFTSNSFDFRPRLVLCHIYDNIFFRILSIIMNNT